MEDNASTCWRQQEELEKQFEELEDLNLEQESYYLELQTFLDNL